MRMANARLVAQMQNTLELKFYGDTAYILVDVGTGTFDAYNNEVITTSFVPVSCSFTDKPRLENWRDYADIENIEAEIRFNGVNPTKGNRVKVTSRFDGSIHEKTFEIIGIQDRAALGYVCALKAAAI